MDPAVTHPPGGQEGAENMPEEAEDRSKVNLEFSEVLHLLSRQAVLGPGVPAKYDAPPWRLRPSQPSSDLVNRLLDMSMRVQAAHIPNTDNDFQEFVLSNASLAVSGLMQQYLSAINISSEIVFGVLRWDEAAREGPEDYEGTPHVWLRVDETPIDNNYVAFPPTADNIEYFYECKKMNAYLDEDPLTTSLRLYLGMEKDDEAMEVVRHNLRIMQTYSKSSNVMKYLAISFKFAELNPGVKMYHILMQDWLKSTLGVTIVDMETSMSRRCWSCDLESDDPATLKTCTGCTVAKYCNRDCQRMEWKVHKILHKEIEHTRSILQKMD